MRDAAVLAAIMPGFGNPLDLHIDDFFALLRHVAYARAVASGEPITMREAVELDAS